MLRKNCTEFFIPLILLILISGCASLPQDFDRPVSYAYIDTDDSFFEIKHKNNINNAL